MTTKYIYLCTIVGVSLLILGAYKLVVDGHFSASVAGDMLPAFFLFYLSYKAYKNKKDQELM